MNSHQRRKARRARGLRAGMFSCAWCETKLPFMSGFCPGCGEHVRPMGELRLREFAGKSFDLGWEVKISIKGRE